MNAPNREQLKPSQAKGQAANVNNSEIRPPRLARTFSEKTFPGDFSRIITP